MTYDKLKEKYNDTTSLKFLDDVYHESRLEKLVIFRSDDILDDTKNLDKDKRDDIGEYLENKIYDAFKTEVLLKFADISFLANSIIDKVMQEYEDVLEFTNDTILQYSQIMSEELQDEILVEVFDKLQALFDNIKIEVREQEKQLAEKQSEWFAVTLGLLIGANIAIKNYSDVIDRPFTDRFTLDDFLRYAEDKTERSIRNATTLGRVFDYDTQHITDNITQSTNIVKREIETELQTAVEAVGDGVVTDIITDASATNTSITGVIWCATLDLKTCLVCGDLHGTVYPSISKAPHQPLHERCRCIFLPCINGNVPVLEPYSEWLSKLSNENQKKILGKTRYALYKQGMSVKNFVNDGRKLTLNEIFKK